MNKTFTIEKITTDIYLITEPWYLERANCYLIKGDQCDLLIDCGLGLFDIREFLKIQGFNPRVFVTHGHFDHVGGLRYFLSTEIILTEGVAQNILNQSLLGLEYFVPEDLDGIFLQQLTKQTPQEICENYQIRFSTVRPFNQSTIKIGKYEFNIIYLPGHTDDSTVLYDKQQKLLISGDVLYDGKPLTTLPNSNLNHFRTSLEYLQKLDIDLVLPGHNKILNSNQANQIIDRWIGHLGK